MTTMDVKDAAGSTVAIEKPLAPGSTTDSASRPVAFSTEGKAQLGAVTETPPASDTASSGLNGRLQRLAQRITSLIALLPTALGSAAASASLAVTQSTEDIARQGIVTETAPATDTASSGLNGRLQRIAQRLTSIIALLPTALGAGGGMKVQVYNAAGSNVDPVPAGAAAMAASVPVTVATDDARIGPVNETAPASDTASSGLNGRLQRIAQRLTSLMTTGQAPRAFSVAFATLTRPANTTAYTALDSISDNATAGSVTALVSGNISDVNDDPLTITELALVSTDTGLNGKVVRAYLYNSDPTASSGVGGGDNAAFSNKKAGYIGSMSGVMETGISDGAVGRLVPTWADSGRTPAGGFIVAKPASGAKTLWVQYQSVDGFTPSANSTTLIGTLRGFQGRAA